MIFLLTAPSDPKISYTFQKKQEIQMYALLFLMNTYGIPVGPKGRMFRPIGRSVSPVIDLYR